MRSLIERVVPLPPPLHEEIVRRSIFEVCRWNTQRGDHSTLAPFAFVLARETWQELARTAEALAAEATEAERELLARPELHGRLGLPRSLTRALLAAVADPTPGPVRYLRFDFHPTDGEPLITEGNPDVCAGFLESSGVTPIVASALGLDPLGDPAGALVDAIRAAVGDRARVGLMHLSMFTDDRQIAAFLARRLERAGLEPLLFDAQSLRARRRGIRVAQAAGCDMPLDLLFRFFPAEWLPRLGRGSGWRRLIAGGTTPVANPGWAVLTQSKRFPLVWPALSAPMRTWRTLLPETRSLEDAPIGPEWVVKPSLGHEGDRISIEGVGSDARRARSCDRASARPERWVAQRRFRSRSVQTPEGRRHVAIGVLLVNGKAVGAYARASRKALIDDHAQDVIVLCDERGL